MLGFELMQRYGPSALFVAAGGYHHHIGLNTWAGVGAPPPPPGALGLKHFVVQLPTPEQGFTNLVRTARPAAILEPSDNPLSGGVGDSTGLLRTLMEQGSNLRAVFAFFWDPELAARCDPGARLRVELGGRLSATWGPPVPLEDRSWVPQPAATSVSAPATRTARTTRRV